MVTITSLSNDSPNTENNSPNNPPNSPPNSTSSKPAARKERIVLFVLKTDLPIVAVHVNFINAVIDLFDLLQDSKVRKCGLVRVTNQYHKCA